MAEFLFVAEQPGTRLTTTATVFGIMENIIYGDAMVIVSPLAILWL